jgi:hypothetical protein
MWKAKRFEVRGVEEKSKAPVVLCFHSKKVALRNAKLLHDSEVHDLLLNLPVKK